MKKKVKKLEWVQEENDMWVYGDQPHFCIIKGDAYMAKAGGFNAKLATLLAAKQFVEKGFAKYIIRKRRAVRAVLKQTEKYMVRVDAEQAQRLTPINSDKSEVK